jgi:hypothetical protein
MKRMKNMSRIALLIAVIAAVLPAHGAAVQAVASTQDIITVGTVSGSSVVDVPVYIRDTSGSSLGLDQPAGSRIQSYSIKVDYAPTTAVQSITFSRAGITSGLTPTFEVTPSAAGSVSLLDQFPEATDLIPFTLDATAPGNQIGVLHVTIAPGTLPGTVINFTLDATLTQLSNEGGSPTTLETTANARLTLVNGSLTVTAVPDAVPTLGTWALVLLALTLAAVALRVRL